MIRLLVTAQHPTKAPLWQEFASPSKARTFAASLRADGYAVQVNVA